MADVTDGGKEIVTNEMLYEVAGQMRSSGWLVAGIDLADVMEYDVLRILGRMFKQNNERNLVRISVDVR